MAYNFLLFYLILLKMKTSLVITTYNWPEALELVLLSLLKQSVLPDEVIIADDGSKIETSILITNFNKEKFEVLVFHSEQTIMFGTEVKNRNQF